MMEDTPGIDDVESAQRTYIFFIQYGSLFDRPIAVIGEIASFQLGRTGDRVRIIIKRMNAGPQLPGCQTEEPASRSDVQKRFPFKRRDGQHLPQRTFGFHYPSVSDRLKKSI